MTWLDEHAKSVYSQNGEDGIIEHVFSVIGYESRLFIEFGFGVKQNNSWRLVEEEGFGGLYIDSTDVYVEMRAKLAQQGHTNVWALKKHLTAENIHELLGLFCCVYHLAANVEIDLLSIDVDGNDYWLWKAIERIRPRLVVIEINRMLGPDVSKAILYDPDFGWQHDGYYGASLRALTKLGADKGYKLIGCEPKGINAFFLRDDIAGFDVVDPQDALDWSLVPHSWDRMEDREWEEV